VKVVVLADTHIRAGGRRQLPEDVYRLLDRADAVLHAGDVVDHSLLDTLRSIAPTYAVLGNNDLTMGATLPGSRRLELGGVRIAMIHDSGARDGRAARLHRKFPDAAVVVFGHSHIPCNEFGVDGQLLFNPGSPTERRSQPHHTAGLLELDDGQVVNHQIVVVSLAGR
jgi:putative phosphoesterase